MNTPDFPEGIALVIGGSGGMGAEICVELANAGSDIALQHTRHIRGCTETAHHHIAQWENNRVDPIILAI